VAGTWQTVGVKVSTLGPRLVKTRAVICGCRVSIETGRANVAIIREGCVIFCGNKANKENQIERAKSGPAARPRLTPNLTAM
jgi:hypothetical protein